MTNPPENVHKIMNPYQQLKEKTHAHLQGNVHMAIC
jgi:hypothetical protein